jgi:2,4-dienoyl-CoA reductase-like NADH-dependent reductase (Old Yellow Enzyme family)
MIAQPSVGGWPDRIVGPSPIQWNSSYPTPNELSKEGIKEIVDAFGKSAKLAVGAGVDSLEIHAAHGYLLNSFLSGAINKRTDEYGGSFENRTRMLFETIASIRKNISESVPLFVRVSGSDWLDKSKFPDAWDVEDTIRLAKMLYASGVDLLDVSAGGNHPEQVIAMFSETQIKMAAEVRKALHEEGGDAAKLLVSAVGQIKDGKSAEAILQSGGADIITCGRAFLEDPGFVLHCAEELGVPIKWPNQYLRRHVKARW